MKIISPEKYVNLLKHNCDKGKHRLRTNKYGVTWCVICGLLSTSTGVADDLQEDDKLLIINENGIQ